MTSTTKTTTVETRMRWNGIDFHVVYTPDSSAAYRRDYGWPLAHLQVYSDRPLPITDTGYRSICLPADEVDACGGPVAYVRLWLEQETSSPRWKAQEEKSRQRSLFDD